MTRCLAVLVLAAASLGAQPLLTLREAGERKGPDFEPAHEGEWVRVAGVVQAPAFEVVTSTQLAIRDDAGYGFVLEGRRHGFDGLLPGDWVEAGGTVSRRGGLPVLVASDVRVLKKSTVPAPRHVTLAELHGFRMLGLTVITEGRILSVGENTGGDYLIVGEREKSVRVFLPRESRRTAFAFSAYGPGDRIRITGLASQYAPIPPYDRSFQLVVSSAAAVELLDRAWMVPPSTVLISLLALFGAVVVWWRRERRLTSQRRAMLALNQLSERIIAAPSAEEILKMMSSVLPRVMQCTNVRMYLCSRAGDVLERVPTPAEPAALTIQLDAPAGTLAANVALCFRNRTLLAVPDSRRSSLLAHGKEQAPRSLMFVPMFAQTELAGVLEISRADQPMAFRGDQQAAAQHLANQAAAAIKLLEQQSIREQLYRSEKLAAAGQLISGIANELSAPLESIVSRSALLLSRPEQGLGAHDLRGLAADAQRASEIVSRLVSLARAEQPEAKPVDLRAVLTGLLQFREQEWNARGIPFRVMLPDQPVLVLGARSPMEQVFLNLLVYAEHCLGGIGHNGLSLRVSTLARRALVEIAYSREPSGASRPDPLSGEHGSRAAGDGLGVCRGIIQGHGGDIRWIEVSDASERFEVELPLTSMAPAEEPQRLAAPRAITTLVLEPDGAVQRVLLTALAGRGHRVLPVASVEEGCHLLGRFHFDAAFCSSRVPGPGWIGLKEIARQRSCTFILLTEGYDTDLSRSFQDEEGYIVTKPIQEAELDRVISAVAIRAEQAVG